MLLQDRNFPCSQTTQQGGFLHEMYQFYTGVKALVNKLWPLGLFSASQSFPSLAMETSGDDQFHMSNCCHKAYKEYYSVIKTDRFIMAQAFVARPEHACRHLMKWVLVQESL